MADLEAGRSVLLTDFSETPEAALEFNGIGFD
jgi:hypothetical protein